MAAVTTAVILEPNKMKSVTISLVSHLFTMKWWDQMKLSSFFEFWDLSQLFHSLLLLSLSPVLLTLHLWHISLFSVSVISPFSDSTCNCNHIVGLKLNIQKTKIMAYSPSPHGKQMGKQWKQWQPLFSWAPKSLQVLTAAMKLKDTCFFEVKLWPT